MIRPAVLALLALFGLVAAGAAAQPLRIGATLSMTGPAASLGLPQRNSLALLPAEIDGHTVEVTILDDASDSQKAVANLRKLTEQTGVDVVIGSSTTPNSLAMLDLSAEKKTPMISLGASARIVSPVEGARLWAFKTPQSEGLMADALAEAMAAAGIKTLAFIGFNDAYGDGWLTESKRAFAARGIEILTAERYARADQSVTAQVLKAIATHPDAMFIAASGTPAALPAKTLRERGWRGPVYQTHGVANADFLRVGGKDVDGTIFPVGPILVAEQLPDDNRSKAVALDYVHRYEAANGAGSVATFGAHAIDAAILLEVAIPVALKTAAPGTEAFRAALRDALESLKDVAITQGVVNMSPQDHNGLDQRARVMATVRDGKWLLLP